MDDNKDEGLVILNITPRWWESASNVAAMAQAVEFVLDEAITRSRFLLASLRITRRGLFVHVREPAAHLEAELREQAEDEGLAYLDSGARLRFERRQGRR